jgi:hypothetical protein
MKTTKILVILSMLLWSLLPMDAANTQTLQKVILAAG